jgi:ATP-binding cassette subfamily B protein
MLDEAGRLDDQQSILRSKLGDAMVQLGHLPRVLRLVWAASKGWTVAWCIVLLLQGALPVATVLLGKQVVDAVLAAMRSGGDGARVQTALVLVLSLSAVLALSEVLKAVASYIRTAQAELVQDFIRNLIHLKSAGADMAFYDSAEFYDHLHRARDEGSSRPVSLLENLGALVQSGVTLLAMGVVLARFGWWIPLALAVSTLPALAVALRYGLRQHLWRRRVTAEERRSTYYDWLLTDRETAAELRLFGLSEHFQSLYQGLRARLRSQRLELARGQSRAELAAGMFALGLAGASMAWMVWRAAKGMVTLGELVMFYQAFQQGLGLMRALLQGVGQLYYNLLFLGNLFEFLSLEPKVISPEVPAQLESRLQRGIRFRDVRFRYPGIGQPALDGFTLAVPAGSIAAVVGPNGAGKSTLLKLLCRFYDPEEGNVEIDGVDLRKLNLEDLRRHIAVLFQQPVHYQETVRDNIALGGLWSAAPDEAIEKAAEEAGIREKIAGLPRGFESILGRYFAEGVELSVGEWQRVALARCFFRQAGIIVLDEPTSAMDPWAEHDWLRHFRRLAEGRTVLIITHRFTTAMYADVIHVMDEGRVVESGTHEELLRGMGRYAAGWAAQR